MVQNLNIAQITTSQTLDPGFDTYTIDASGGSLTVTLPVITTNGMNFTLRRIDVSTTNTVTVTGSGGAPIDNTASITLAGNGCLTFTSLNGAWFTIAGNNLVRRGLGSEMYMAMNGVSSFYRVIADISTVPVGHFIYRESEYYASRPVVFTVEVQSDSTTLSTNFEARLVRGAQTVVSLFGTAGTSITRLSTSTFGDFSTLNPISIEVQFRKLSSSAPDLRVYSVYLQLN